MPNDIARIAAGLNETQRDCTIALCGNAWDWSGKPSPGLALVAMLGFMTNRRLGVKGKSNPTPLGLAVREHLKGSDNG